MSNNSLSVLYKHIIQVENKNVGLKCGGGGGHKHTIAPPPPPQQKKWGHMPLPASYASDIYSRTWSSRYLYITTTCP